MELNTSVSKLPMVGPRYIKKLETLGINSLEDLLLHIPSRYIDYRNFENITDTKYEDIVTIHAQIVSIKNIYTSFRKKIQVAEVSDTTGIMQVIWFNQVYLAKSIKVSDTYSFSGKVGEFNNKKSFISPYFERIEQGKKTLHTGR